MQFRFCRWLNRSNSNHAEVGQEEAAEAGAKNAVFALSKNGRLVSLFEPNWFIMRLVLATRVIDEMMIGK